MMPATVRTRTGLTSTSTLIIQLSELILTTTGLALIPTLQRPMIKPAMVIIMTILRRGITERPVETGSCVDSVHVSDSFELRKCDARGPWP